MDTGTTLILVVVALLGINHMVFRLPGWEDRPAVFWGVQLTNLTTVILLLTIGIPGFAGATHAINWVLGLLFVLHIVTNNGRLVAAKTGASESADSALNVKRDQIKAALQRGNNAEE
jgi:hypothetical protein